MWANIRLCPETNFEGNWPSVSHKKVRGVVFIGINMLNHVAEHNYSGYFTKLYYI